MHVQVDCPCGARVLLDTEKFSKSPCPRCGKAIAISWWKRWSLSGKKEAPKPSAPPGQNRRPETSTTTDEWGVPSARDDLRSNLESLAQRAWGAKGATTAVGFLFSPTLLLFRDDSVIESAIGALYAHARAWAPGLETPFHVPRVRVASTLGRAAGQFAVDQDGWLSINIAANFFTVPRAVWVILAHEVCHHILAQSGLADHYDTDRNERMTDAAMFVCGFGNLVKAGQNFIQRREEGYFQMHLGYLRPNEYSFAHHWTIAARIKSGLPGMAEARAEYPDLPGNFQCASSVDLLLQKFRGRFPSFSQRERLMEYYSRQHPDEGQEELINRILEDYEHDRR